VISPVQKRMIAMVLGLTLAACAHDRIANTGVEDTEENRAIYEIIRSYERALEARDTDAVMAMVSSRFYEDNGNTDRADDYDYAGLKSSLAGQFDSTKKMQVEIEVGDIRVEETKAFAYVFFMLRAQSEYPTGDKWKTASDRARIEFERQDDRWLILSGL